MSMRLVTRLALATAVLSASLLLPSSISAEGERFVTIAAQCVAPKDGGLLPDVQVRIENDSGLTVTVGYAGAFGITEGAVQGFSLAEPEMPEIVAIANTKSASVKAPWIGGELRRSSTVAVMVVTSAGVFLPACGADEEPLRFEYAGDLPKLGEEEDAESAQIAAEMIGQLESWLAYPALYSLLHPEARAQIPYAAIACWYQERFGPPVKGDAKTIYSTKATDVVFEDWTYAVSGTLFEGSASVTYEQKTGVFPDEDPVEPAEMHLVRVAGLWNWFFGASAEGVAALKTDCDLPKFT